MKRLAAVLILALVLLGCTQSLGKPKIESIVNKWGSVTEDYTEIVTEIKVYNPNPVPIPISDVLTEVYLNGMKVGEGKSLQSEIKPNSKSEIVISTKINNSYIPKWWVSHVKNNEKSVLDIKGYIVFDLKVTKFRFELPEIRKEFKTNFLEGLSSSSQTFRLGIYKVEVESIKAHWGKVDENVTEIVAIAKVRNDNLLPLVFTKTHYVVKANGIVIGEGYTNVNTVIQPKSTSDIPIVLTIETPKLKDWWVTHIRNGEKTKIEILIKPFVEIGGRRFEFSLAKMETIIQTQLLG
ncbi:LEA type 2 family protein [Archaeoglobus sp.]